MENQDKKTWESLTQEEKTTLLNHWYTYYGGILLTLEDLKQFHELSKTKQDEIFSSIVTLYIYQNTIQSNLLTLSMRDNELVHLFKWNIVEQLIKEEKAREAYREARNMIFSEIQRTYLKPEPPVPMTIVINEENPKHTK